MARPVPRASLPDLVFAELREAISSGRYAPGERLPTQRTLAAEMGVNLAAVREALGRLEQLRLVEIRHGDATRVLDWRQSGGLEALAVLGGGGGAADETVVGALFEARRLLLTEAARLAATRRTDEQAAQLAELAGGFALAGDEAAALLADWAFMAVVVEAAGNLVFQLIMNSVREVYLPQAAGFVAVVADREELVRHYERAAEAICAADADGAARAIEALALAQEKRMMCGA
jgi:GntR family transcriptional regulator, transcriptional repressor for pyruvate dehydrogenase complex